MKKLFLLITILFLFAIPPVSGYAETPLESLSLLYGIPQMETDSGQIDMFENGLTICHFPEEGIVILYKEHETSDFFYAWEENDSKALERFVEHAYAISTEKIVYVNFETMEAKQYPDTFTAVNFPDAEKFVSYELFLDSFSASGESAGTSVIVNGQWPEIHFQSHSIKLTGSNERVLAYIGPDKQTFHVGGYRVNKAAKYTALFREGNYIYCDAKYSGVERRCVYFNVAYVSGMEKVASVSFEAVPAVLVKVASPRLGPGEDYELYDKIKLMSGTAISVCGQYGDWLFIEYPYSITEGKTEYEGMGRGWVKVDTVEP